MEAFSKSSRKRYVCCFSSRICFLNLRFLRRDMYFVILVRKIILFIERIDEREDIHLSLSSFFYSKSNTRIFSHEELTTNLSLNILCDLCEWFYESLSFFTRREIYISITLVFCESYFGDWDNSIIMIKILRPHCDVSTWYFSDDFLETFLFYCHISSIWKNPSLSTYKLYSHISGKTSSFLSLPVNS